MRDDDLYIRSAIQTFESFYGPLEDFRILALLPSYLERSGSSLIFMVDAFMKSTKRNDHGFFLNDFDHLEKTLKESIAKGEKVLLLGVSFALLDFAEKYKISLNSNCVVMETGGMKGRRKEIVRSELHSVLRECFSVDEIHSEYGMTELFSQAYSRGNGLFECPYSMRVLTKEVSDPFALAKTGKTGQVNIIDLANIDTCAFIETSDLGQVHEDLSFEILGRRDVSDRRGCNLLYVK